MGTSLVLAHDVGDVRVLSLNRHTKRNALSVGLCTELADAVRLAPHEGIRALVITGEGSVFSAGADLTERDFEGELYPLLEELMHTVRGVEIPVVAFVNGPAIGAGMMLAMACDVRVQSGQGRVWYELPVAKQGIGVDAATVAAARDLLGGARARQVLLLGREVTAEEALTCGFALEGSLADATALAAQTLEFSPFTLKQLKMDFAPDLSTQAQRDEARAVSWRDRE